MTKELELLEKIKQFIKPTQAIVKYDNGEQQAFYSHTIGELFSKEFNTIESALKSNKRKLDLIGEILVDVSKGNYADLNDAINEIREVLGNE